MTYRVYKVSEDTFVIIEFFNQKDKIEEAVKYFTVKCKECELVCENAVDICCKIKTNQNMCRCIQNKALNCKRYITYRGKTTLKKVGAYELCCSFITKEEW